MLYKCVKENKVGIKMIQAKVIDLLENDAGGIHKDFEEFFIELLIILFWVDFFYVWVGVRWVFYY